MKHCPSCGEQYEDSNTFCGNDGTRLEPAGIASPARCRACGESLEAGASFCPECGAPYHDQGFADSPQNSPSIDAAPDEREKETFEEQVSAAIRSSFPDAVIRERFRIQANDGTNLTTDLLVINRTGIFLIECQNCHGKIRGSPAYDYRRGELWTCQTPAGRIVQIASDGKNPAQRALDTLSVVRERASTEASHIHSVLLFPDGADLSGIEDMRVSAAKPSKDSGVTALALADLCRYIAAADGNLDPEQGVRLIDAPPIPRTVVSEKIAPDRSPRTDGGERPFKEGIKPIYVIGGAAAVALILLAALALQFLPPGSSKAPQVAQQRDAADPSVAPSSPGPDTPTSSSEAAAPTKMAEITTPNPGSPPTPSSGVITQEASRPSETKAPAAVVKRPDQPATIEPGFVKKESSPPKRSENKPETSPSSTETPIPRRPAEPGTYEAIKTTAARMSPSDSSDVLDQLKTGTRLNVTGSDGDWLVVQSKTRNRTVYVHREDAMLLPPGGLRGASGRDAEVKWKEVETQIRQAIAQRGITGVSVSFIGDTAYLRGKVETEDQRYSAEQAARSTPEVVHIHNGIWLNR